MSIEQLIGRVVAGEIRMAYRLEKEEKDMIIKPLSEPELPHDYPVHPGYFYVVNGQVIESPISGDVAKLRRVLNLPYAAVCRCDIYSRQI